MPVLFFVCSKIFLPGVQGSITISAAFMWNTEVFSDAKWTLFIHKQHQSVSFFSLLCLGFTYYTKPSGKENVSFHVYFTGLARMFHR